MSNTAPSALFPEFFAKAKPLFGSYNQDQVNGINAIFAEWAKRGLNDLRWLAYILATVHHETGKAFKPVAENLNYSAQGLANNWPSRYAVDSKAAIKKPNALALKLAKNPVAIANNAYANRMGNGNEASGDGWKYRGRGLPQTTGKTNYQRAKTSTGVDFIKNPDLMLQMQYSVQTMFDEMIVGGYTGKKLSDYFPDKNRALQFTMPGTKNSNLVEARKIINGLDKAQLIADYAVSFYSALT